MSVSVFKGNTGDPTTLLPQVNKVRKKFGIKRFVMVGDRGMITQKQVNALVDIDGIDWIGALRPEAINKLVKSDAIQMSLFDDRNLFELSHPDFPGERLVACRNRELAKRRANKRKSLLEATRKELETVQRMIGRGRIRGKEAINARVQSVVRRYKVGKYYQFTIREDDFSFVVDQKRLAADVDSAFKSPKVAQRRLNTTKRHIQTIADRLDKVRQQVRRGRLYGQDKIGVRVGKVLNKYRVGKHFKLDITDDTLNFEINQQNVDAESALDGIYVVRTSLSSQRMSTDDTVRSYKLLGQVERAFRSMKTLDLFVRPIHHRLEDRVRAHILLCMLAYYVQWHMLEAWRPLLFSDEEQEAKATRDPVAPAKRSDSALRKVHTRLLDDGSEVHSFRTLLSHLSGIVRNVCRVPGADPDASTFEVVTTPNLKQQQAYDLLLTISP